MIHFDKKGSSDSDYIRYLCKCYEKATPEEKLEINKIIAKKAEFNSYIDKRGRTKNRALHQNDIL